jgi:two-component system response regulator HydG
VTRSALIVDDNRALAEDLGEILEGEGFVVRVFFDPLDAVGDSDQLNFDVALLDVRMPGMDGVELFRALARAHPGAKFILMSAYADDRRIREALAEGVELVLSKPVSVPKLLHALLTAASNDS